MDKIKQSLIQRALWLEYLTVSYNLLEGLISVGVGIFSNSIALISFGMDSFVESISGSVLVWRLKAKIQNETHESEIEKRAIRYVGYSFLILSAYVGFEAVKKLYLQEKPEATMVGIVIALLSIVIMPFLMWQKYQIGKALNSRALIADSKQTLACIILSIILLVGLFLNYYFNLWWADPVACLLIVIFMVKEGMESFLIED